MMKVQLKNWSVRLQRGTILCLQGNVYGHPNAKHHDGKFIVTSKILGKRNGLVVTWGKNEYELLEMDSDYEKKFPGAREKLFNQLKDV